MKKNIFIILFLFSFSVPVKADSDFRKIEELIFGWQMGAAEKAIERSESLPEHILGLYEFYSGNYKEAQEHFEKSAENYSWWLDITEAILPITKEFKITETDFFIIRYTGKDEIIALYLKDILNSSVEKLYDIFEWKPDKKVILEIYPDRKSFQTASTLTDKHIKVSGAIGICKFNRIMLASPRILKFGYSWVDTSVHEYVHYIIGRITGLKNMPLWLNEGIAKYLQESWRKPESRLSPVEKNFLNSTRRTGSWVEFDKMKHGMPNLDTRDEVTIAFAQVHSIVKFLEEKYGWEKIRELLYMLKNKSSDESFKNVFNKTVNHIQQEWEEYIKEADLTITPGAAGPSYAFEEDPVNAVSEWVSETAATDLRVAERFNKRGNFRLSEKKFIDALKKDPGNPVILNRLAKVQVESGKVEQAVENFLEAINNNPSYPPPYLHLGKLMIKKKDYSEAAVYISDYVYKSPFNPESHKLLLDIYDKTGKKYKANGETEILNILNEN